MNGLSLCAIMLITGTPADGPNDAAQMLRLLRPLHAKIRDVSFVYEGERNYVGPMAATSKELASYVFKFQGDFQCRENAEIYLQVYTRLPALNKVEVRTCSLVAGRASLLVDQDPRRPELMKMAGGITKLYTPSSPLRFFVAPYFYQIGATSEVRYSFEGWEQVGGHECISFTILPYNTSTIAVRYWVDLRRGGHALRIESRHDQKPTDSIADVELKRFRASDGENVWLPIRAVRREYTWNGEWYKDPMLVTDYHVLESSLNINKGLRDSDFDLKQRMLKRNPRGISREWLELAERGPKPKLRTDPEGVKSHLDTLLAEADRQSRIMDASASAKEEESWVGLVQIAIMVIVLSALLMAGIWRFRAR